MLTKEETNRLWKALAVAKEKCKDAYAQSYLQALDEAGITYGQEGLKIQILYALNNMASWKGEEARETKKTLRSLIKKML